MNSSILIGLIRSANGVVIEVKVFDLNITQTALKKCIEIISKFCQIKTSKIISLKKQSTNNYRKKIKLYYKKVYEILGEDFINISKIKSINF